VAITDLPAVNATLNAISAILLLIGYVLIRRKRIQQHRRVMIAAFATSTLFLISYVIYHANVGSKPFPGQGSARVVYFVVLITHIVLAALVPPLALITLVRGLSARYDKHRRLARWTLPIWLYVSITGVIVYVMLYHAYAAAPAFRTTADQNVLLITVDTLRADALGHAGGRARTPNLDRLASEGIRFTFAHAHAVTTLPSHASIMSGRYPYEHGVRDNAGYRLDADAVTIAESAEAKGMATAAFVGAFPVDRQFGLAQGFDVYEDVGGRQVAQGELSLTERRAADGVSAAQAWIDKQSKPWFVWVHVFDPHAPYAPPAPFDREYAENPYAGEVAYVDQALGSLVDRLRDSARMTTIVVTGDHGEGLGEHGELTHGTFAYESTLRVPLILAQLGAGLGSRGSGSGAADDRAVEHVDIFPTIASLAGLNVPAGLPGRSLLAADDTPRTSYFEAMSPMLTRGWAPLRGIIDGRHKYIDLPIEELYDLEADPREGTNLASTAPGRLRDGVEKMRALNAALPGERLAEGTDVKARLQSLGYVSGSAPRKARYTTEDDPKGLIELDRLMLQGLKFQQQRRTADAVAAFRTIIDRRPDMTVTYRRLASAQWDAGLAPEAIATLRESIAKNGRDIETEVRLGTYLAEAGHAVEAIDILERASAADPRDTEALNALGIAYAQGNRAADALRAFEAALKIDSRDVFAYENIGTVHLQRQDLDAARASFVQALDVDPRSSRAHAGLGVIARQRGRVDEAISEWTRAVELDRSNYDALFNLARELAAAGRHAEARTYASQFVQTAPHAFYARDIEAFRRYMNGAR
jgi:arylsulfatase A-like enzyme/uncharacterized membrane protein YozB (DUF420 family)/tetratricopeptide (TPR) repeat protein